MYAVNQSYIVMHDKNYVDWFTTLFDNQGDEFLSCIHKQLIQSNDIPWKSEFRHVHTSLEVL